MTSQKKPGLKVRLAQFAKEKYPNWINGSDFEMFAITCGKKGSNGSRRCRELADEGTFERRMNGKSVEYRYKQKEESHELPQNRRCYSCNKSGVRFYAGKVVCPDHSPVAQGMF